MTAVLIRWLTQLRDVVSDISSTNWLLFTGTVFGGTTVVAFWTLVSLRVAIPLEPFLGLLAFLAGWMGFGVRQFRHKRETYDVPGRRRPTVEGGVPPAA